MVKCEDNELVLGAKLKVRDNGKYYVGCLMNPGKRIFLLYK